MKFAASLLASVLLTQAMVLPYGVAADVVVNLKAEQAMLHGEVACNKVGAILLAEGLALINDADIKVEAKEHSPNSPPALHGSLFKVEPGVPGTGEVLHGYAFFREGSKLHKLRAGCPDEGVDLVDGSHIAGRINDITKDTLSINSQNIPIGNVAKVMSPRVFKFHINGSDSPATLTKGSVLESSPVCTGPLSGGITEKKVVVSAVLLALIATGVSCGVAIPLGVHHHHAKPIHFTAPSQPATPPVATVTHPVLVATGPKIVTRGPVIPKRTFIYNPKLGKPTHPVQTVSSTSTPPTNPRGTGTATSTPPPPPPTSTNTATSTGGINLVN